MTNLTYKINLRLIILAFLTIILFIHCSNKDDQNLKLKNKQDATIEFMHLKNLLPPGMSYKVLRKEEDILDENKIYLIDQKKEETSYLLELCNQKGIAYLVRASCKEEKEAIRNSVVAFSGDILDNVTLYMLSYIDPKAGRKSIFYREGNKCETFLTSSENLDEKAFFSIFNFNEIKKKIKEELLSTTAINSFSTDVNRKKNIFTKYQNEVNYFIEHESLKYDVRLKVAKGKTEDNGEEGYGIHIEYVPESGVTHTRASFGRRYKNPRYDVLRPSRGMKYYQELKNLITSVTFVTELQGNSFDRAIIKDYSPIAKIGNQPVTRTRSNPSYSFIVGGSLKAGGNTNNPSLAGGAEFSYIYNSETISTSITQEDVNFLIDQTHRGKKIGIQYVQDLVGGRPYLAKHHRTPLGNYIWDSNDILMGRINKILPALSVSADRHLFYVDSQSLPAFSRSNTNPNAMINYFIPKGSIKSSNVYVKAIIYLDYVDVKAGQTPDEVLNFGAKSSINIFPHSIKVFGTFCLNLKKIGT